MKRKTTNRKVGRPKAPDSLASIAERLTIQMKRPITIAMARVWKSKGFPLDDPDALQHEIDMQTHQSAGSCPEHIREAIQRERLRKLRAEASTKELELEIEKGKFVLAEAEESAAYAVGLFIRNQWEGIEDELPPLLEGLTALQMKTKLREFARVKVLEIHEMDVRLPSPRN